MCRCQGIDVGYQHYIDQEQLCVFIKFFGEIDHDEIREQANELTALPGYTKGMSFLRDLSLATLLIDGDLASIKEFIDTRSKTLDETLGGNRRSAWVLSNVQDFKLIHRICALSRLNNLIIDRQPFRDIAKAREWIGIPEDYEIKFPVLEETT